MSATEGEGLDVNDTLIAIRKKPEVKRRNMDTDDNDDDVREAEGYAAWKGREMARLNNIRRDREVVFLVKHLLEQRRKYREIATINQDTEAAFGKLSLGGPKMIHPRFKYSRAMAAMDASTARPKGSNELKNCESP